MACLECEQLERKYRRAVGHIDAVVHGRYASIQEKLNDLRSWQERRDLSIERLYHHKKSHARKGIGPLEEVA